MDGFQSMCYLSVRITIHIYLQDAIANDLPPDYDVFEPRLLGRAFRDLPGAEAHVMGDVDRVNPTPVDGKRFTSFDRFLIECECDACV